MNHFRTCSLRGLLAVLLVTILSGCNGPQRYDLDYSFELVGATAESPLRFADERFEFQFIPGPSGVAFQISNISSTDAVLVWDDCYFVEPDGNTYKALNTDALEEADAIVSKSRYTATIPAAARLARFTTASVKARQTSIAEMSEMERYYTSGTTRWSSSDGLAWTATTEGSSAWSASTFATVQKGYRTSLYWKTHFMATIHDAPREVESIRGKLARNDRIGIGLKIDHAEGSTAYRFDFAIKQLFVTREVTRLERAVGQVDRNVKSRELAFLVERNADGMNIIETAAHADARKRAVGRPSVGATSAPGPGSR